MEQFGTGHEPIIERLQENAGRCYQTDNRFAYFVEAKRDYLREIKMLNFTPTRERLCIACEKKAHMRCGRCRQVWFCGKECQRKAWAIHSKHCGRDLFVLCARCGSEDHEYRCESCPTRFCSDKCLKDPGFMGMHAKCDCAELRDLKK